MEEQNYWQCSLGKHTGKIKPGSIHELALRLLREEGNEGPLIVPSLSCPFCIDETHALPGENE
jgi:hypothetical protein